MPIRPMPVMLRWLPFRRATLLEAALVALLVSGCELLVPIESPSGSGNAPSLGALPSTATPTPRRTVSLPQATPLPSFAVYTVRSGDTLLAIARRFRTTPLSLSYWNRDRYPSLDPDATTYRPNLIEVGWRLRVIAGVEADPEDFLPEPSGSPIASSSPSTG